MAYTDAQREVVVALTVDEGLSPREAVRRCEQGVFGLDPFTMEFETAKSLAYRARRRRRQAADRERFSQLLDTNPDAAIIELVDKLMTRVNLALDQVEQRLVELDDDTPLGPIIDDIETLAKTTQTLTRIAPAARRDAAKHADRSLSALEQLVQEEKRRAGVA